MLKSLTKILIITAVMAIASFNVTHAATNTTLDFDGSSDYVAVGDNAVLDQANRLSLSVWIEPDDTPGGDEYILYRYNNYYLKINSSCKIVGGLNDATERITSATAITCDGAAWTHIEMTYDKDAGGTNEIKLYINGVLDATADYSTAISASDKKLYIGAGDTAGDNTPENWFDGQIDSVQLYQYARSADNVRLDYNEGLATHLGPSGKTCSEDPASCMDYGLVGSWNMDEGTGTTIYDGSDEGNDGTLIHDPKWTTGKSGSALQFDGVDDYVDCGNDESLNSLTTSFSISMWVKRNKDGSYFLIQKGTANNNAYIWYGTMPDMVFLVGNGSTWDTLLATNIFPDSNWYHIVTTFNNGTAIIYRNGVSFTSKTMSVSAVSLSSTIQQIGARVVGGSVGYFGGTIDEVRIYNRALSAEEVRYHYNHGEPVASWNFDEGSGTVAYDGTANNNDGTLGGGTAAYEPSWVEGKHGGALSFDGVDDYVDCGNDESLNITDEITIEAWVKMAGAAEQNKRIIEKGTWDVGGYRLVQIYDTTVMSWDVKTTSERKELKGGSLSTNVWHHVVGTYENGNQKLYYDGNLNTEYGLTGTIISVATDFNIGSNTIHGECFNGSIDDVRIYNYARTPEQILQDYNAGKGVYFR